MQLGLLLKAARALRAGRFGDAVAYKAAALGAPARPDVQQQLDRLHPVFPRIDPDTLRRHGPGTFGAEYLRFIQANRLSLIAVTDPVASELAARHALAVRYPVLHDAFHVLLGFDVSLAGELGVWSFVAAQRYSPSYERAAALARHLYPLLAPAQLRALRAAALRGKALGHEVPCLIAQPLEAYWHQSLPKVRQRLHIRL